MTNIAFQVPPLFDYFATFLWALSGAILGMHKRYDMAGVCVLFVVLVTYLQVDAAISAWVIIGLFFTIRALAVRYDWTTQAVLPHTENE